MCMANKTIVLRLNKVNFEFDNPYAPPKDDFASKFHRNYSQDKLHSKLDFHNFIL